MNFVVKHHPTQNHVSNSPSRYTNNQPLMENSVSGFLFYARFVLGFDGFLIVRAYFLPYVALAGDIGSSSYLKTSFQITGS